MIQLLDFPTRFRCDNGTVVSGEEAFLFLLARYRNPAQLYQFEQHWGRDYAALSRIFAITCRFMWARWGFLLVDNLKFFCTRERLATMVKLFIWLSEQRTLLNE